MRRTLILIAALGLGGCPETASERQARDELERIAEEREREQAAAEQEAAEHLMTFGLVGAEPDQGAPSGDLASDAGVGQAASCADITDAEAFVRCLYEGLASGAVRAGQESDGPDILSERYWRTVQQMRAAGPGWANMDPLCLCNTPGAVRVRSIGDVAPTADGASVEVVTRQDDQTGHLRVELLRTDEGWRVNDVIAHSG